MNSPVCPEHKATSFNVLAWILSSTHRCIYIHIHLFMYINTDMFKLKSMHMVHWFVCIHSCVWKHPYSDCVWSREDINQWSKCSNFNQRRRRMSFYTRGILTRRKTAIRAVPQVIYVPNGHKPERGRHYNAS